MKKLFVLFLTSALFASLFNCSFADSSKVISLQLYKSESVEKNGRQFRQSAFEEHEGHLYLMLTGDISELTDPEDIHRGTPVIASLEDDDYAFFVDHVHLDESGEMMICIEADGMTDTESNGRPDLSLKFYSDDFSSALYSANIKNLPTQDEPTIPQTGDGAVFFILTAVASLFLMAFLLAPKKRTD